MQLGSTPSLMRSEVAKITWMFRTLVLAHYSVFGPFKSEPGLAPALQNFSGSFPMEPIRATFAENENEGLPQILSTWLSPRTSSPLLNPLSIDMDRAWAWASSVSPDPPRNDENDLKSDIPNNSSRRGTICPTAFSCEAKVCVCRNRPSWNNNWINQSK